MRTPLMHIPDGFINVPTALVFLALAVLIAGVALRGTRSALDDKTAPLAGLAAVFIFAVQMLNFPVAAGTSGHLMGGALAAILVGPSAAILAVLVVLVVQAIVFHDGGLVALGLNIFNISIVAVISAWLVYSVVTKVLPKTRLGVLTGTALASFISVPLSAMMFVVQYGIGGTTSLDLGAVTAAMLSVHLLIGLGEAAITVMTVGAVLSVRPDLVYGARRVLKKTELIVQSNEPANPSKA